jgi:hypothetical protein
MVLASSWRVSATFRNIASSPRRATSLLSAIKDSLVGRDIQTILEKSLFSLVRMRSTVICSRTDVLGIFMICVSPAADGFVSGGAYNALYASILGAFLLTILLLFVSGLNLQERPGAKKRYEKDNHWEEYSRYLQRTSILIPFPPQLYEKMPTILKRTILLEFPIYVFDPAKHSSGAKGQGGAEEGTTNGHGSRQSGDQLVQGQHSVN